MFLNKVLVIADYGNMDVLFSTRLKNVHTLFFLIVLFFNLIWGERFLHWFLTTFILWSTIKIYLGLWIVHNFLNFIGKSVHMFHHISTLMSTSIQYIIQRKSLSIITWNVIYNLVILVLFVNCIKLPRASN
jgi:hypothetical protein